MIRSLIRLGRKSAKQGTPVGRHDQPQVEPQVQAEQPNLIKEPILEKTTEKFTPKGPLVSDGADFSKPVVSDDIKFTLSGWENTKTGEVKGPKGPEPTRFGDWEHKG